MSFSELFTPVGSRCFEEKEEVAEDTMAPCLGPICEALEKDARKFKRFSKIKWDCVENRCSPMMRPLNVVVEEALGVNLSRQDHADILYFYCNPRGRFQHKAFLKDIFNAVLNHCKRQERYGPDMQSVSVPSKPPGKAASPQPPASLLPANVEKMVSRFGVYNNISCHGGIVRKTRDEGHVKTPASVPPASIGRRRCSKSAIDGDKVVEKLRAAIAQHSPQRLGLNVETFRMIPDMDFIDFAKEMRRVLNLALDKQEARTLFDLFDFEGIGVITESQLHEGLAKLHIAKVRALKKQKILNKETAHGGGSENPLSVKQSSTFDPSASVTTASTGNSFVNSQYSFNSSDFQKAILKLSKRFEQHTDHRLNPPQLRVPDGYLNRKFVRRAIREQLEVKLSISEIDALCHKLSYASTDERAALNEDELENPKLMFIGKTLKALIVRVGNVVVRKLPSLKKSDRISGSMDERLMASTIIDESNDNSGTALEDVPQGPLS